MNLKNLKPDKVTIATILCFAVMIGLILSNPKLASRLSGQTIMDFKSTTTTTISVVERPPTPDKIVLGFQSIAFQATPDALKNFFTWTPGPAWITHLFHGIPIYIWLMAFGIVLVYFIVQFLQPMITLKDEPNKLMKITNILWLLPITVGYLYMGFLLTTSVGGWQLFYFLLYLGPIGLLLLANHYLKISFNVAWNDYILGFVDALPTTQLALSIVATFGIFFLMGATGVRYTSFAISGDQASSMALVPAENQSLLNIPTQIFEYVGLILLLVGIGVYYGKDVARILSVDVEYIVSIINEHKSSFYCGFVVVFILTGTMVSYIGSYYHVNSYSGQAARIAEKYHITEEQAYTQIMQDVSNFWCFGSFSLMLTGTTLPIDFTHLYINYKAASPT